jgi:hypothetical protein
MRNLNYAVHTLGNYTCHRSQKITLKTRKRLKFQHRSKYVSSSCTLQKFPRNEKLYQFWQYIFSLINNDRL